MTDDFLMGVFPTLDEQRSALREQLEHLNSEIDMMQSRFDGMALDRELYDRIEVKQWELERLTDKYHALVDKMRSEFA